ncbi:hypothetical protein I6F35_37780 [Bradyrhizobium sp. BRP22]|uniref:hypothetical protein n=1 Tax=Bradyrhizobium sp. BRP22 TaxID=2793821 RepID=UPI001CD69C42|nr:hypothetical protein [Bradyrhizobium sp. BRP22]MCA1458833.1 hypothetical protein [Bradyrhizobium sp. BRP22]
MVWYSRNSRGQIELFDLMGFHPQTGEELIPITREVADAWKQQTAKIVRRVAVRVDEPEKFGFFDPTTGAAKIWYWRSGNGECEFYDGPGFHPRAGEQLQIVTRDVIAEWRHQQEAIIAKKRRSRSSGRRSHVRPQNVNVKEEKPLPKNCDSGSRADTTAIG